MSRIQIEELLENCFPFGVDVNSFRDTKDTTEIDFQGLPKRVFSIVVDNLEYDELEEYGQGRSAGCAATILEAVYGKGIAVFSDYRYYPNNLIYNKLVEKIW